MIFAHFLTDVNEANMFLVACAATRKALLIDAPCYDVRLSAFLEEQSLSLEALFITHDHYDHVNGIAEIMERYAVSLYAGSREIGGVKAHKVQQDDVITFGAIEARVLELPGHTSNSLGLVMPGMVFTGDALFAGSIGGVNHEKDRNLEIDKIRKHVFTLPDDYQVHTGHSPSSTVYVEKTYNPFFVPNRWA
ncbi:MAG: MBL fold metallo-hydrolase [Candidatus Hydrogenedentes bacterium]|nr:MBL fold metallo-hydrolase [Candidatus Hydrogenedentota bacterium]